MPVKNRMIGHPVHYFVKIDDFEKRKKLCRILLSALYANGRIKSRRFCFADFDSESNYPDEDYEALYKSCENGAVIVRYGDEEKKNGSFATSFSSAPTNIPLRTTGNRETKNRLSLFLQAYIKSTEIKVADVPTTVSIKPTVLNKFAIKQPIVIEIM